MLYPEVPIFYAWLIILVMVGLNRLLGSLQYQFKGVNTFLEGVPRLLVKDGKIIEENLHKERLRKEELFGLLRELEVANTGEVKYIFLEQTGNLGLVRQGKPHQPKGEETISAEITQ